MSTTVLAKTRVANALVSYYDPTTAQFLAPDPLYALTGSRYGYAGNDPINGSDPTGLCSAGNWILAHTVDVVGSSLGQGDHCSRQDAKAAAEGGSYAAAVGGSAAANANEVLSAIRPPDYYEYSSSMGGGMGFNFIVTSDGQIYFGPSIGTPGMNAHAGWLNRTHPSRRDVNSFASHSCAAFSVGGPPELPGSIGETYGFGGTATELGVGTPGPSVSYSYDWHLWGGG